MKLQVPKFNVRGVVCNQSRRFKASVLVDGVYCYPGVFKQFRDTAEIGAAKCKSRFCLSATR